jgi:hypothetical protein
MRAAVHISIAMLVMSGCGTATQSALGEPIEMGPYTFAVISATQGQQWESIEGPYHEIVVRVRVLRDGTEPFTDNFSSSFIDNMRIVDAAGNSIGTSPTPVAPTYKAGRYRSEYYTCLFRYSRSSDGVRDFANIGTRPQDFTLVITNPAPEGAQAHRVSLQLS